MVNKKVKYTFRGAIQDISKSKHPFEYYFEGQHIKIFSTDKQATGSVSNEKGNELIVNIPSIIINDDLNTISYTGNILYYENGNEISQQLADGSLSTTSSNSIIIGHTTTREGIILFTTDDNNMDCIWLVTNVLEENYNITLLYLRNLGFSINNPIQAIFNYENENIQKIYWVDGKEQIRYLNITHSNIEGNKPLIEIPSNSINFVGDVNFSQPYISNIISGGSHTSGMIQYSYNLYRLNGSQSKLSPLSELIPLSKGSNLGGGDLNEVVGSTPVVIIPDIDNSYTNINVYAIKYTSFNEIPSISLIEEVELNGRTEITVFDDGSIISSLSLDEFIFLGSNPVIAKHIESKDNRLFLANLQDSSFDIPDDLDFRAYSFPINSTTTSVWSNPQLNSSGLIDKTVNKTIVTLPYNIPLKHDSINLNYDNYKYQYNSSILGGSGKYIKYQLLQKTSAQLSNNVNEYRFLKDQEIYRIGIELFNSLGQTSPPKWIADFKTPIGNLQGNYNTLKVELTSEFYNWLNTYSFETKESKPVGYKIIRADRTLIDRTILCQGVLTQMMCQTTKDVKEYGDWIIELNRKNESSNLTKFPIPVSRGFLSNISPIIQTDHLRMMNEQGQGPYTPSHSNNSDFEFDAEEIFSGKAESTKRQQSWQFTKLFQLNSPDILFNSGLSFSSGLKFKIKGLVKNTKNDIWYKRTHTVNESVTLDIKDTSTNNFQSNRDIAFLGLFGPSKGNDIMDFTLINREYLDFYPSSSNSNFNIYGSPEITERGQGVTSYNGDPELKYSNTMEGFLTDRSNDDDENSIISMNSYGNKCLTFSEGIDNAILDERKGLEDLHTIASTGQSDGLLLAEIIIPDEIIYLGNIYGGNSYENKSKTTYIEIGTYKNIDETFIEIDNAGDTYIYDYRFARISKTDTEILDDQVIQLTEVIKYPIETYIDLKNRNDKSLFDWDAEFQPRYDDYHKYNRVYSQQPNLVGNTSTDFTFKKIKNYDTRIQSTKLKIPNESIDSWTDLLENETMDLDGKYGPINSIVSFKDNIFSFQDEAISSISINPRIQVQGNDGVGIELGTGGILYDYNYLTTKSGSINKWGIIQTKKGIYYYDALNKAIGRVPDMTSPLLTDLKGMHTFFNNNYNYNLIKQDNPLLKTGVVFGYDNYNNDVYFTLLQGDKSFTRCFNETGNGEFIDLKTYKPSRYINKGEKFIITDISNTRLYEQYKGIYNNFFGIIQPSYIILQLNPESDIDCIFNNIHYNSELYLNDIDMPDKTLTHIQAYNEYQDSGKIPLIIGRGSNIRRKFREWQADIPRDGRNRIRNPWIFLKLELDNTSNYKLILHDIIIHYSI
jgi:hypothetical protein